MTVMVFRFWPLQSSLWTFLLFLWWMFLCPGGGDDNIGDFLHHWTTEMALREHSQHQLQQRKQQPSTPTKRHTHHEHEEQPRPELHIYVLAGQSNMLGYGSAEHMMELIQQHPDQYGHLLNIDLPGWRDHSNVLVVNDATFGSGNITTIQQRARPLTMGLGLNASMFGPELGFGWTISAAGQQSTSASKPQQQPPTILLIKAAWNSKSLAIDFRPPSAGLRTDLTNYKGQPVPTGRYGACYRSMMERVSTTLRNLPRLLPDHFAPNETSGTFASLPFHWIKGLVWFQGWNDRVPDSVNAEYSQNLQRLIQDVRDAWKTPHLPVVIGGLGQRKKKPRDQSVLEQLVRQQVDAAQHVFHARFVPTAHLFDPNRAQRQRTYGVGFHYHGYADTIYQMGQAFGEAMLELQQQQQDQAQQQQQDEAQRKQQEPQEAQQQ